MLFKTILIIFFIIGLVYLLAPTPTSIHDFPGIPDSIKSQEAGDTVQNPNNSAYYTDYRRKYVTSFYKDNFETLHSFFGFKLPAIRINHPPEEAFVYIRDQQTSTYLEEYLYPLKDSLFVNGFEPFDENGKPYNGKGALISVGPKVFNSKVTLRFYGSSIYWKIIVYIGIWAGLIVLFYVSKKILKEKI